MGREMARILIVEDERVIQTFHQWVLEKLACVVDIASTGTQALEKYMNNEYDFIMLDCGLPDMDGFEVCRRIRRHEKNNEVISPVPIVMVSAFLQKQLAPDCKLVGINELIIKPITGVEEMRELLKRWLPDKETMIIHDIK
jgi:CheY-like chemotaxis protein